MSDDDDEGWDVFESAVGSSRFSSVESDRFSGSNTFRGRASTTGRERASTATRRWRSSTVDDPHVSDEERGQVLALLGKAQPPPYGIFWVDKVQEKSGGKHAQKRMLAILLYGRIIVRKKDSCCDVSMLDAVLIVLEEQDVPASGTRRTEHADR